MFKQRTEFLINCDRKQHRRELSENLDRLHEIQDFKQNLQNIETEEHGPDEQKDNRHSPDAVLTNSMFLIKLEDMHVVYFISSEDRNAQANRKKCVAHHKSESHYRTTGFDFRPEQV